MADLTNHQLLLMEIRDKVFDGNASELARRLGKDPTYVNRWFYPKDKSGHKGLGLGTLRQVTALLKLPPGFWERDLPVITDQEAELLKARVTLRNPIVVHDPGPNRFAPGSALNPMHAVREFQKAARADHDYQGPAVAPPPSFGMEPILSWEHPDDLPDGEFVMVPRLDVHLSAGGGRDQVEIELVKDNPQAFRAEWIRLMRLKPGKLAAMRASGESMEPTIHDGDSLLVDTADTTVVDGRVYALWYDGGERVKRLFRLPGGGLRIHSDNPDRDTYPDMTVRPEDLEHVRVIGRVVHRSGVGGL